MVKTVVMDEKLLLNAVDIIIKDAECSIDECLVQQFIQEIPNETNNYMILDRVKSFMDHKSFVMLNQARAFKILQSALDKVTDAQLDSMWRNIDVVILNDITSAMAALLSILNFSIQRKWCNDKIDAISNLAIHCLNNMNNYHAKKQAGNLLLRIMERSLTPMDIIMPHVRDDLPWSYDIVYQFKNITENEELQQILTKKLESLMTDQKSDLTPISKCLARISTDTNEFTQLALKRNRFDGLVVFLCEFSRKDSEIKEKAFYQLVQGLQEKPESKVVKVCLSQLMNEVSQLNLDTSQTMAAAIIKLIMKSLSNMKNILNSVILLKEMYAKHMESLQVSIRVLLDAISTTDTKPVAMSLIGLLSTAMKYEPNKHMEQTIDWTLGQSDTDIINEMVLLFYEHIAELHSNMKFLNFVVNYDLDCDNHDLIANICSLLKSIDTSIDREVLLTTGIIKHHTIPLKLASVLTQNKTVSAVTERVVELLDQDYLNMIDLTDREKVSISISGVIRCEPSNSSASLKDIKDINSMAQDIINYDKISHSISDCY